MIQFKQFISELNIKHKDPIGDGEQGIIYNVGKDRVVKKSRYEDGFTDDEIEKYKLFNKYPNNFPHVYKLSDTYIVMEKLDLNFTDAINFYEEEYEMESEETDRWRYDDNWANYIYDNIHHNKLNSIKNLLKQSKQNNINAYNTYLKTIKLAKILNKIFKNEYIDFHSGNLGLDKNGNLKIFDLSMSV